jgi:LacI family transcriptional regulator
MRHAPPTRVPPRAVASAPDRTGPRAPRIRDVAARAGVGVGTVSRVLNDAPGVADATRRRVRTVMKELGYRPSSTARNLSLGRTQTLCVIAPFFTSPSVVERLRGIDDVVADTPYDLTMFNIETREQRRAALRRIARRERVDGVIIISLPLTANEVRTLERDGLPAVLVDVRTSILPHVAIDDVEGGAIAARHLIEAGHRRVAFVGDVKDESFGFASGERRLEGFRSVLGEAGVALSAAYVKRGPFGRESAGRLTRQLLELRRRPTAIFAASDVQAFGVLDAAARAGVAVPEDLSVIGFDDIELAAAIGLTTVRQPLRESGRIGAQMLLRALDGGAAAPAALPELTVVERRTVGSPG